MTRAPCTWHLPTSSSYLPPHPPSLLILPPSTRIARLHCPLSTLCSSSHMARHRLRYLFRCSPSRPHQRQPSPPQDGPPTPAVNHQQQQLGMRAAPSIRFSGCRYRTRPFHLHPTRVRLNVSSQFLTAPPANPPYVAPSAAAHMSRIVLAEPHLGTTTAPSLIPFVSHGVQRCSVPAPAAAGSTMTSSLPRRACFCPVRPPPSRASHRNNL